MNSELLTTDKLLVNQEEAADLLGVSTNTLRTMRREGEISSVQVRPGKKGLRFAVQTLRAWVAKNDVVSTEGN